MTAEQPQDDAPQRIKLRHTFAVLDPDTVHLVNETEAASLPLGWVLVDEHGALICAGPPESAVVIAQILSKAAGSDDATTQAAGHAAANAVADKIAAHDKAQAKKRPSGLIVADTTDLPKAGRP